MKRCGSILASAACLAAGFGAGWALGPGPEHRHCAACAEIIALQSKPDIRAIDLMDIDRLKKKLASDEDGRAALRRLTGDPPDLHPECECPCHRYWIGPASRVHDAT